MFKAGDRNPVEARKAFPLRYVVVLFALLQVGLAIGSVSLVVNMRDAALLTNIIGFQRSLVGSLGFYSGLPTQTRAAELKRQEKTTARFESAQKALAEGGRVVLPNGDEANIQPLECRTCAPRIAAISFKFADFVAAGEQYVAGLYQSETSLEALRKQEAAVTSEITGLVEAVRRDYDSRANIAVYVVVFVACVDTAFFALVVFWIRAQFRARIRATSEQERETLERAEMERALIGAAHNAIIVVDEAGTVELFNPAAETIFGFTSQQMVGQSLDALLPAAMKGAAHTTMMQGFAGGSEASRAMGQRAIKGVRADGSEVPLFASIAKLPHKEKSKFVAILMDVSAHQRAEQATIERAAAVKANEAKTRFLATISHELRTPLNAIAGFAQLAEKWVDREDDPKLVKFIGAITEATKQLSALINDVLDIQTIESGGISLNLQALPLRDVLLTCIGLLTPEADSSAVIIELVPFEPAPIINADKKRLKQVIDNLLSNAIKYNQEGGRIHTVIKVEGRNAVLQIIDTGLGMSPLQLEHLFEPFNRLGAERSATPGTGLGLSLVKQIVEAMGGAIEVKSKKGQGTTVSVELPLAS